MRRIYIQPVVEVVKTQSENLICLSDALGDTLQENLSNVGVLDGEVTSGNLSKGDFVLGDGIFNDLW